MTDHFRTVVVVMDRDYEGGEGSEGADILLALEQIRGVAGVYVVGTEDPNSRAVHEARLARRNRVLDAVNAAFDQEDGA